MDIDDQLKTVLQMVLQQQQQFMTHFQQQQQAFLTYILDRTGQINLQKIDITSIAPFEAFNGKKENFRLYYERFENYLREVRSRRHSTSTPFLTILLQCKVKFKPLATK